MHTRIFALVLLLSVSQAMAQSPSPELGAAGPERGESQPPTQGPESRGGESEQAQANPSPPEKAPAFQPSEEIMADTMLTLPADI